MLGVHLKSTTIDSALVLANVDGKIIGINGRCSAMFGYTPAELVGKPLGLLMPAPYTEQHESYVKRYVETGIPKVNYFPHIF